MNFPTNPAINSTYTIANKTWIWNGSTWTLKPPTITDVNNNLNIIGNVTATSFIKTGGTGTQFLMANGTVATYGTTADSVAKGNHTHSKSDITNFSHTHNISEIGITGLTTNCLTKFNGSTLVNSMIFDNASEVTIGTIYKVKFTNINGHASWIDLPAVAGKSTGIGSGGAGVNPWVAYAGTATNWFMNSSAGDICYRNTTGKLLFGNTTGNASVAITGNRVGIGTASPSTGYQLHIVGTTYSSILVKSPKFDLGNKWDLRASGAELHFYYNGVKKGAFTTDGFYSTGEVTAYTP